LDQTSLRAALSRGISAQRGSVRWLATLAVLGMFGHGLAQTITGPVLPEVMSEFAVRETAVGMLLAAGSLGFMLGCLLGGFVIDEIGLKPVVLTAWLGVVASLVGFATSQAYGLLVVAYGFLGLGSGCLETGLSVLPTQVGGGAGLMNLVHLGYGVGALVAPLLAGSLLNAGPGWRVTYWVSAAAPIVLLLLTLPTRMPVAPRQAVHSERQQPIVTLLSRPLIVLSAMALLFYVAAGPSSGSRFCLGA